MIIVRATDGIGNQLFQYAIGRRLSLLHNTHLFIDSSHFVNFKHQRFSLKNFDTDFSEVTNYKILALKYPLSVLKLKLGYFRKIEEKQGNNVDVDQFSKDSFLIGYWQSETYFKSIRQVLLQEIQIKVKGENSEFDYFKCLIEKSNSVSLHVRRGDFLQPKNKNIFQVLEIGYYKRAVELIRSKLTNPIFFIFSDDIKWVKNNMRFLANPIFVESKGGLRDFEELILMSICKHNIIANSTFSWWAAWLNNNAHKIVVQPENAYNDIALQHAYESGSILYSNDFIKI